MANIGKTLGLIIEMINGGDLMFKNTNLSWLEKHTIILAYAGSIAYGTTTEDSDTDFRGVCIPPEQYYFGLENFESYHSPEGSETDTVVYSLQKYAQLAIQNNPNVLEILFTKPEHFKIITKSGKRLVEIRHQFLSKQFYTRTNGYARGQYHEMIQNGGKPNHGQGNPKRMEMRELHGYDVKAGSHLIRLMYEGIEVLETGELNVYRPERDLLTDIKLGKYKFEEVMKMYQALDNKLKIAYEKSKLPEKPDYHKINNFIIELTKEYLND
jgi:predicted nucleotidyltransferase